MPQTTSLHLIDSSNDSPDQPVGFWVDVLAKLATQLDPQSFDTWFRPVTCVACDRETVRLTVPNAYFARSFLDNFNDMLCQTVADILGTPRQLCIAIEKPECTPAVSVDRFPVVQAAALEKASPGCHWLIDRLWMAEAVGFLGAPPKSLKTWLALEMAVAVASGLPCLGTFSVSNPGPVLLYAAEDSVSAVRARLESIACHHRIALNQLALWVITAAMLRLDRPDDQQKLEATVAHYQPRLLVLDPLIRLHQLDENAAGPMAALLGFLRSLQRKTSMAIALVHHTRKNSAAAGYTLRGSSDFYAWTYVEVNISPLMCSLPLCAIALCSAINCQIHLPEHST